MFASALRVAMSREAAPAGYFAEAIDASLLYLSIASTMDGLVDGKTFACSYWFKLKSLGVNHELYSNQSQNYRIRIDGGNLLRIDDTSIIQASIDTLADTSLWHHWACSFDMADTGKRHSYLDGVSVATWNTYVNANVDFQRTSHGFLGFGGNNFRAYISDLWWAPNQYIDLSLTSNRLKFRSAAGKPVFLGDTGLIPTTVQPLVFFTGDAAVWNAGTNVGSAQNFTASGTTTDSPTSPSD